MTLAASAVPGLRPSAATGGGFPARTKAVTGAMTQHFARPVSHGAEACSLLLRP